MELPPADSLPGAASAATIQDYEVVLYVHGLGTTSLTAMRTWWAPGCVSCSDEMGGDGGVAHHKSGAGGGLGWDLASQPVPVYTLDLTMALRPRGMQGAAAGDGQLSKPHCAAVLQLASRKSRWLLCCQVTGLPGNIPRFATPTRQACTACARTGG